MAGHQNLFVLQGLVHLIAGLFGIDGLAAF
jgi:hypothetical protein